MAYSFLKGHGTENDFVLLPDHDGTVHGGLDEAAWAARVRALCGRRTGIGGDGVLRVVRDHSEAGGVTWFMDYRNGDGSVSEMCGNGVRVFALHLIQEGLVTGDQPIPVGTRDGVKTVTVHEGGLSVDMGVPRILGSTWVAPVDRAELHLRAETVDLGNPHAVAFVEALADAGALTQEPVHDNDVYPEGVNIEFVERRGERHIAMRVHERGSGETRSCGTGACAAMVVAAVADGLGPGSSYAVDVPGGSLVVTWTEDEHVHLAGPAVIVARGVTDL